jgi:hypothetical protein
MPSNVPTTRPPTPHDSLNRLLAELVVGARAALGERFVGAYLLGSFAIGGADAHSDVDFVIVTEDDIPAGGIAALNALHAELFALPAPWAQRLDGSYVPRALLRRWSHTPRDPPGEPRANDWADPGTAGSPPRVYPFLYLGNGQTHLVRSEHDNTRVMRWTLRERGIVLAGPDPRDLVDPVSADDVREEVAAVVQMLAERIAADPQAFSGPGVADFMAVLAARMAHTISTGEIHPKAASVEFAAEALPSPLARIITRAWANRNGPPNDSSTAEILRLFRVLDGRS